MRFAAPLAPAVLVRRYKRFLADVVTGDGTEMTLHCPNTGAMTGCAEPGFEVRYALSDNPRRKYPGTWVLARDGRGDWICVDTSLANTVVGEALTEGRIPALAPFDRVRREVRVDDSRVDFLLRDAAGRECVVEVKSVTLRGADGLGLFPDARSERARRHLALLARIAAGGGDAALIYCVQHTGIDRVAPADDIDPDYGIALRAAMDAGVRVSAWRSRIDTDGIELAEPLPVLRSSRAD